MTSIEIAPLQVRHLVPAAGLWADAERARVGTRQDDRYVEEQRTGFVDTMGREDAWGLVALAGDQVVGVVGGFAGGALTESYLAYVVVDPKTGRQGVGRRLLDAATRQVRESGGSRLLLTVHETNVAARTLYETSGWQPTGKTERTPIDEELLVEYRLDL